MGNILCEILKPLLLEILTPHSPKTTKQFLDLKADSHPRSSTKSGHTTANKPPAVNQRTVEIGNRSNSGGAQVMGDVEVKVRSNAATAAVAAAAAAGDATKAVQGLSIGNVSNIAGYQKIGKVIYEL